MFHDSLLLIPILACLSTSFIECEVSLVNPFFRLSPALVEAFQSFLLTAKPNSHFSYSPLCLIDSFRIRFNSIVSLNVKDLVLEINDFYNPFSSAPIFQISMSTISMKFKKSRFKVNCGPSNFSFFFDGLLHQMCSLPSSDLKLNLFFFNFQNEIKKIPTFVPVDSSKLASKDYDPFFQYRTKSYGFSSQLYFEKDHAIWNLDLIQPLVDYFYAKRIEKDVFQLPPIIRRYIDHHPQLNSYKLKVRFPFNKFFRNKMISLIQTADRPLKFKISNSETSLSSKKFSLHFSENESQLGQIVFNRFLLQKAQKYSLFIRYVEISIIPQFVNHLSLWKCDLPFLKKNPISISSNTYDYLSSLFKLKSFHALIPRITITLTIPNGKEKITCIFSDIKIKQYLNPDGCAMSIFSVSHGNAFSRSSCPLISFDTIAMTSFQASNIDFVFVKARSVILQICEGDNEVLFPTLFSFTSSLPTRFKHSSEFDVLSKFQVENLTIRLLNASEVSVLSLELKEFYFGFVDNVDESQNITSKCGAAKAIQESANDHFHLIFEHSVSVHQILWVQIIKAKRIMKYPVYDNVNIKLSPFELRISIPFFQEILKMFPFLDSIRSFDIESEFQNDEGQDSELLDTLETIDHAKSESSLFLK
jgi:hypothetical protein